MSNLLNSQISRVKPLFDFLKKQRENQKFIERMEIASTFALISFFMFFAIRPTALTISSLLGDIESKKVLKKELRSKINDVIQAQESFSEVQERYHVINNSLPDRPSYYQAAYQVQKTGELLGINIDKITFNLSDSQGSTMPDVQPYTISLDIDDDFMSSTRLISDIIGNQRATEIKLINFGQLPKENIPASESSSSAEVDPGHKLKTRFSVKFYYWPSSDYAEK
jgi:hypothetical protein